MHSTIRIAVLREEFTKLGYKYETQLISGVEYTKFISPNGLTWLYKDTNGRLPFPYVGASRILNDKMVAARYAREKGVRVPRVVPVDISIQSIDEYRRLLGVEGKVVVKPTDGTLSRGVSANVEDDEQLVSAIAEARKYSQSIVVQERIEGDEFRFVYVGAHLKAVIHKQKAKVTGNGYNSVRELVLDENRQRLELTGLRARYPQLSLRQFEKDGIDLMAVPHQGEVVQLGDSTMLEDGASFYEVSEEIHGSYKEISHILASDFGGGYLAVDLIIHSHSEPATDSNYAFLEYNDLPAPLFYYVCRNQPEVPVMRDLVQYIDRVLHVAAGL